MSGPSSEQETPIENKQTLIDYLASGSKPREQWRVGTEHEKFGFRLDDLKPIPYEGERGIAALLDGLMRFGWDGIYEGEHLIALSKGGANISLEPAGQLELSGAPLNTVHETCAEVAQHLYEVKAIADNLRLGFLGMGFQPKWSRSEMPWMPKGRYKIMREYMPKVGNLGLDMMTRTCTIQSNLDFGSEADMIKKFRVSLALQPIATALFADSPFTEGKPNGFLSFRSQVWRDTDPDRTGMLDFVFDAGFGFERYVDYALDVPMYFAARDGAYVDCSGKSFRKFLRGELDVLPGEVPSLRDWSDHLTTIFPEVRLKKYLEMRGADGGPWNRICALSALWVGLFYDDTALDAAWDLVKNWSSEQRHALRDGVGPQGFRLAFDGKTVRELSLEVLRISQEGLLRRAQTNCAGADETHFLEPLIEIALSGQTPAERKLELYHNEWNGSVDPLFRQFAY